MQNNDVLRSDCSWAVVVCGGALFAAALVGCTSPNPAFMGDDRGGAADRSLGAEAGRDAVSPDGGLDGARRDVRPGSDTGRDRSQAKDKSQAKDLRPGDLERDVAPPPPDSRHWCTKAADCDDHLACTDDVCTFAKDCQHTIKAGACLIGGVCVQAGQVDPANPCRSCQPGLSTSDWRPVANGAKCTPDALACTADVCMNGTCQHTLAPASCLIGGACFAASGLNPSQSCQSCQPTVNAHGWTVAGDGTACASDGLACTTDTCQAGVCDHDIDPDFCVIGKVCRPEGYTGPDVCNECVTAHSRIAFTFVAGKPCSNVAAGQIGGMCWQNKCSGWAGSTFDVKSGGNIPSALNSVATVASSSGDEVWAAGEYGQGAPGGALVMVSPSASVPVPVLAPLRFTGIHHHLAVGDGGQTYFFDGQQWAAQASLEAVIGGANLRGVWGNETALGESYWISGFEGLGGSAMLRCNLTLAMATCDPQAGFPSNVQVGPVSGPVAAVGMVPAWALPVAAADDIYYRAAGGGKAWTRSGPEGCQDLGIGSATPCSGTTGDFRDLFVASETDGWAVGTSGILLQWDGNAWTQLPSVLPGQASYSLDAVYTSRSDGLVTIAAHAASGGGRAVVLFNYNRDLDRWLGPITLVAATSANGQDEIRDLGGTSYANLFAVGTRLVSTSGTTPHMAAWVLQLK